MTVTSFISENLCPSEPERQSEALLKEGKKVSDRGGYPPTTTTEIFRDSGF